MAETLNVSFVFGPENLFLCRKCICIRSRKYLEETSDMSSIANNPTIDNFARHAQAHLQVKT